MLDDKISLIHPVNCFMIAIFVHSDFLLLQVRAEYIDVERQSARHFARSLNGLVRDLLALRSSVEVDAALQEFASKYCQGLSIIILHLC